MRRPISIRPRARVSPPPVPPSPPSVADRARPMARRAAVMAALCVATHFLIRGYALVARVRVELVPAAGAPAASAPALCGTAVVRG